jgi:hypothetical protein
MGKSRLRDGQTPATMIAKARSGTLGVNDKATPGE